MMMTSYYYYILTLSSTDPKNPGATMNMHVHLGLGVAKRLISILPGPYPHCYYTMCWPLYSASPQVISFSGYRI